MTLPPPATTERSTGKSTWGGRRPGAGRKRTRVDGVAHRARPSLTPHLPAQITLKVDPSIPGLRRPELLAVVEECLRLGKERPAGFRLVHYCVLDHTLLFIVEATDRRRLSRGMKGLGIRVARQVNKHLGRSGRFFAERYAARVLLTPQQVRQSLAHVLNAFRREAPGRAGELPAGGIDDRSSGRYFDGWVVAGPPPAGEPTVVRPRSWLLVEGWRPLGPLRTDETAA